MEDGSGSPPGWPNSIPKKEEMEIEKEEEQEQEDEEDDGPPPGWLEDIPPAHSPLPPTPPIPGSPFDIKMEQQDMEDEGPPPGWGSICQSQPQAPQLPTPPEQIIAVTSDIKMGDEEQDVEGEEGPPPGWGSIPLQQSQVQPVPPTTSIPPGVKMGSEQQDVKDVGERPPHGRHSMTSTQPPIPVPKPPHPVNTSEKGQMVCGSCRRLLSYLRGAKYVKCACCQTVNLVLEEHEVGQVKCGGCAVLLMYPYGAPSVKCLACHAVTEIGAHNRRPPLSVQQRRVRRHPNRVH